GRAACARGGAACGRGAAGVLLCVAGGHRPLLRRADRAAELPAAVCVPWSAGRTGARRLSGGVVRSSREVNRRERWSALRCCRSGGNTSMVIESDVLIIGSGITAAMVAEKLAEERDARIVVVEAGGPATPLEERPARRARYVAYGENPWPGDHVEGLAVEGMASRTMQVGGQAMRWGGVTPRFSPEDFRLRSLYGVGEDWPITYEDLDPFYQEAEERIGVAGVKGPPALDPRSKPYPLLPLPQPYNLEQLLRWGERAGIPLWSQPSAKASQPYRGRPACCRNDTCAPICPIGAKYSPDFTWRALVEAGRVELIPRTVVRRLVLEPTSRRVSHAIAVSRDMPDEPIELHARAFVLAGGYLWTPYLLLLSAEP